MIFGAALEKPMLKPPASDESEEPILGAVGGLLHERSAGSQALSLMVLTVNSNDVIKISLGYMLRMDYEYSTVRVA